jgi:soluble lytic murein transglycosylase-like protein
MEVPKGFRFYRAAIGSIAAEYGLEPALVHAVVWQESGYNTDAFRHEPDFWNRYLKMNPRYRELNPRRVSSSYGLMQVMFCRIWEDKIADNDTIPPEHLFVPEIGLHVGCGLLAELLKWAAERVTPNATAETIALAAYNGGRGGNDPTKNWPLRTASYAAQVLVKKALVEQALQS